MKHLFIAFSILLSSSVSADLYRFGYEASHSSNVYDFTGYVVIDSEFTTGIHNVFNEIDDWEFLWDDGAHFYGVNGTDTDLSETVGAIFAVDFDSWEVVGFDLCSDICNVASIHDSIRIRGPHDLSFTVEISGVVQEQRGPTTDWAQSFTAEFSHASSAVPEPTSMVLVASGLLGFAATRRTKKQA